MGFKRILVALDRSSQAPFVFEQALEQAQYQKSELLLLHAIHSEPEAPAGSFMGLGTIADVDTYGALKRLHHE
ncbi:MAG TPA: universal stress protein, partial [Allocoleopsis sp.]